MKDVELQKLIAEEVGRQNETINLIASENLASLDVLAALGSPLSNKYSEGYPGARYYPGNGIYDQIELLAQERALRLFGLSPGEWAVNVQPLSGSPANVAIYSALMAYGETFMAMGLSCGGHLSHGHKVSLSGKWWRAVHYAVDPETGLIDYEAVRELALREKPKVIVAGFTAYPGTVDFAKFGEIAREAGAYLVADISHIAGLIAAGLHPSPYPYADVVMTTTHKTLRGPRGAVIFSRKDERKLNEKIDKAVFPGMQGGPHNNVTAAKAVAFFEALGPEFREYQKQVVENARVLAEELVAQGFSLLTSGTDTHLMLLDMRKFGVDGKSAEMILEKAGIMANRNSLPGDEKPLKPSGVRLGTPAVTTRGMKEAEMKLIASFFARLFIQKEDPQSVRGDAETLCARFPLFYKE